VSCEGMDQLGEVTGSNPSSIIRRTADRSHWRRSPRITASTTPISFRASITTSYCLKAMLDRRTTLCLACSSSLPPNVDDSELFITKCCGRPIFPRCLEKNRGWRDTILVWYVSPEWGLFRPVRPPEADLEGNLLVTQGLSR
jgi:hypothetical protein